MPAVTIFAALLAIFGAALASNGSARAALWANTVWVFSNTIWAGYALSINETALAVQSFIFCALAIRGVVRWWEVGK